MGVVGDGISAQNNRRRVGRVLHGHTHQVVGEAVVVDLHVRHIAQTEARHASGAVDPIAADRCAVDGKIGLTQLQSRSAADCVNPVVGHRDQIRVVDVDCAMWRADIRHLVRVNRTAIRVSNAQTVPDMIVAVVELDEAGRALLQLDAFVPEAAVDVAETNRIVGEGRILGDEV